MIVKDIVIPQVAIDAGNAVLTGETQAGGTVDQFRLDDVRDAIGGVLRPLHYDSLQEDFDYGPNDKDRLDDRIADRLMSKAKREGKIEHLGNGVWRVIR